MSTLVFSIGLNGYGRYYRRLVASHRRWSARHGYDYAMVDRPSGVHEAALAAWLKVPLLLAGLDRGYDRVIYLDADVLVRDSAPGIEKLVDESQPIRMALGRTGRLNSGVIIALATDRARGFLREVLSSVDKEISEEARARLKYENGNIIYVASTSDAVGPLDQRWNNSSDPDLDDFARHYTGPLKSEFRPSIFDAVAHRLSSRRTGRMNSAPSSRTAEFARRLDKLAIEAAAQSFPEHITSDAR